MEQEKVNSEKENSASVESITREEKIELENRRTEGSSRNSTHNNEGKNDSNDINTTKATKTVQTEDRPTLATGVSIPSTVASNISASSLPTGTSLASTRPTTTVETSTASSGWDNPNITGALNAYSYDLRVKLLKSLGVENISRIDVADNKLLERFFNLHVERERKEIELMRTQNLERLDVITERFIKSEKFTNDTISKLLDILNSKGIESVDALGNSSPTLPAKRADYSPTRLMSPRGHKRYKSEIPTVPESEFMAGQPISVQQQPHMIYQPYQTQPNMIPQTFYMQQGQQQGQSQQGQQVQMWPSANSYQQQSGIPVAFHAPSLPASHSDNNDEIKSQINVGSESTIRSRHQSVSSTQQGLSNPNSESTTSVSTKIQSGGEKNVSGKGSEQGNTTRQYSGQHSASNIQFATPAVSNPGFVSYQTARGPYVVVPQGGQPIQNAQYVTTTGAHYYPTAQQNVGGLLPGSQGYQPSLASTTTSGSQGTNSMLPSVQYRNQAGESLTGQAPTLSLTSSSHSKKAQSSHRRTQSANVALSNAARSPTRNTNQRPVNFLIHTPKHPPPT
ncbi:Transcriptional activator POG1 [Nakaseomyces bracarensis]|uniref:Transcriptional activator POG1 n=1 Tax=Nakaseomyces bracarensis TaxID=273131 RepID=A0ABR4NYY4_9SACH